MKYVCLSFLLMALAGDVRARISFGGVAGMGISDYYGKTGGVTQSGLSSIVVPRIGVLANVPLTDHIDFQPGFGYCTNGYKTFISYRAGNTYPITVRVNCLESPLNIMYMTGKSGRSRFFIGAGPYFTLNMSGKVMSDIPSYNTRLKFGDRSFDDLRRIDVGGGVCAGYLFAGDVFIRVHFQNSVMNLQPRGDADNTTRNTNYGVTFGYLVKTNKKKKANPPVTH